jgi:hypothetical protein
LFGLFGSRSPRMIPESPTCPMKILPRFMKQTDAVVPAVEGSPDAVFFQLGRSVHMDCWVARKPSRIALRTWRQRRETFLFALLTLRMNKLERFFWTDFSRLALLISIRLRDTQCNNTQHKDPIYEMQPLGINDIQHNKTSIMLSAVFPSIAVRLTETLPTAVL